MRFFSRILFIFSVNGITNNKLKFPVVGDFGGQEDYPYWSVGFLISEKSNLSVASSDCIFKPKKVLLKSLLLSRWTISVKIRHVTFSFRWVTIFTKTEFMTLTISDGPMLLKMFTANFQQEIT